MLKSYLVIALRGLRRHRAYSFINIAGLAVGMACVLMIFLYIRDERSYDQYHEKKDRVYRLVTAVEDAAYDGVAKVPGAWGTATLADLPGIEAMARLRFSSTVLVSRGEQRFYEGGGFYTDPSVFDVFSFAMRQGDPATALDDPNGIVLTESLAQKYFPGENPLGQALTFDNRQERTVTGVLADVPANSHFTFTFLLPLAAEPDSLQYDWVRNQHYTYLLLHAETSPDEVLAQVPAVLARRIGQEAAARYTPRLQALTDIHLGSNLWREMAVNGNKDTLYLFGAVAFFILLIACINFMNLATARSARRAREVGVRKASGARRSALMQQFLGESILMSSIAVVLGVGLVSLLLPSFNQITGKALSLALLLDGGVLMGLVSLTLLVGLMAGSYPAFVLSAFRPVSVLKGDVAGTGRAGLRKTLVVVQFAISIILIVAVGVIDNQLRFIQSKDLGFNKEQIVIVPIRNNAMTANIGAFKQELLSQPGVVSVAASGNLPGGGDWGFPLYPEGIPDDQRPPSRILAVDHDFIDTYQMEIVAGRNFTDEGVDAQGAFLLNEEAAQLIGWADPIGKMMGLPESISPEPLPVVGVVKDFHFRSLHESIGPLVFFKPPPFWLTLFSIRISPDNVETTLARIEAVWDRFDPAHPMTHAFLDQNFEALYQSETLVRTLLNYAMALAIFIACLGLFGLAAFTAEQRTKEIGIRKVLGASASGIVLLLSKDFARLVALAFVVAAPLAYFAMKWWLNAFAYQTDISGWIFLMAGSLALAIALATVGYQAVRAALGDPVKALRYE